MKNAIKAVIASFVACLVLIGAAQSAGVAAYVVENTNYLNQFAGADKLSDHGVMADGTDQTTNLNNLPTDRPLEGDCKNGSQIVFTGVWYWKSNHRIKWDRNCKIASTMWATSTDQPVQPAGSTLVAAGTYPIQSIGGFTATSPITGVEDYYMNFSFLYPSEGEREMQVWADTLRIKHSVLDGSCGFGFNRGGDQSYRYNTMKNTLLYAGCPGLRHVGNLLSNGQYEAPTGAGLWANVDAMWNNWPVGDAPLQACQPTPVAGTWGYAVGSRDIGYFYDWASSGSSALLLVGLNPPTGSTPYPCSHVRFFAINGSGITAAIIVPGAGISTPDQILVDTVNYTATPAATGAQAGRLSALAAWGIGNIKRGPTTFAGALGSVTLRNVTSNGVYQQSLDAEGAMDLHLVNDSFGAPSSAAAAPNVLIEGATSGELTNLAAAAFTGDALQVGGVGFTTTLVGSGLALTGVQNGYAGLDLKGNAAVIFTSGSVAPAPGNSLAVGLSLTADPNGTHGATVNGFNLSAMPIAVNCASGQGNAIQGCAP